MKFLGDVLLGGRFGTTAAVLWLCFPPFPSLGGEASSGWLTGVSWREKLQQPADVFWQNAPLGESLRSFSAAHRIALLIDRRVDPGQPLDLKLQATPVLEILLEAAAGRNLGLCLFGPVTYIGPASITRDLRTVGELRRDEIRGLPSSVARKFAEAKPLRWDDFAMPRDVLAGLAAEGPLEVLESDRVPHDLWAAADLPPLPLSDRLTLVLGQFDLTFQVRSDGGAITLVPIARDPALERSYPGGRQPEQTVEAWKAVVPEARFEIVGPKIVVRGRLEEQERIKASRRPASRKSPAPRTTDPSRARYTVEARNEPLEGVLRQFAAQLGLELKIDAPALDAAGVSLQQLVSFDVEQATIEELLNAVLLPAGCQWQRTGDTLEIRPAGKQRAPTTNPR
jgi:hypothetical protein